MDVVFAAHLFVSFFMAGLCWFVQIVHYPLFLEIPSKLLPHYERKNIRTGYITVPMMIIELATGLILLYHTLEILWVINALLMIVTALSTFFFQAPMHLLLTSQANEKTIKSLINTNWIRTSSWTLRSGILLLLLLAAVSLTNATPVKFSSRSKCKKKTWNCRQESRSYHSPETVTFILSNCTPCAKTNLSGCD